MITEHPKKSPEPPFLSCENDVAQLVTINVAQLVTIKMAKRGPVSNFTAYVCVCVFVRMCVWGKIIIWDNFAHL